MRWSTVVVLAAVVLAQVTALGAQQVGPTERLWSGVPPGAGGQESEGPRITPYLPAMESRNGSAVVVFPGGGYQHLAVDHEGRQVAEWLNGLGVAAFVVEYRLGPDHRHPAMLQDAQRAVRLVRSRAADWGIDGSRVGVIGFSAGGHLASTVGTHYDDEVPTAGDAVDQVSARPDFMMLIYPVVTMQLSHTHRGSRNNLLGDEPADSLVWALSNETQVTPESPPAFLVHTTDDSAVPVENSLLLYSGLRQAGVPVEMHVFETGRHGFGLGPDNPVLSAWPGLAERWMQAHGWLPADG